MDGLLPHGETLDKAPSDTEDRATETPNRELVDTVRAALRERTEPERAAGAHAYMKSAVPSLGVRVPEVRHLAKAAAAAHPLTSAGFFRHLLLTRSTDQDFWIRRSAITSQLKAKPRTDQDLLRAVIEPNLADLEFFIRKAIGGVLREYAKSEPDWVRNFVAQNGTRLSPLSRKEAMRHLEGGPARGATGAG
ncbi:MULTISPECIES: DNA alkylation repair protein [unclassified Arthrobacter]|uniref:DNA alkylation repair protein n=1 Tax=unclassified Pseudarthrobacter TaxID=2647000 RepID=UPI0033966357